MATIKDYVDQYVSALDEQASDAAARDALKAQLDAAEAKVASNATIVPARHDALSGVLDEGKFYAASNGRVILKVGGTVYLGPVVDPASVPVPDPAPAPATGA